MDIKGYKKHKDLIEKWADGAKIEYYCRQQWYSADSPAWTVNTSYRLAPVKKTVDAWLCVKHDGSSYVIMATPHMLTSYSAIQKTTITYKEGEMDI